MGSFIQELVNRKVTIYTEQGGAETSDVGVIERVDEQWLRLRKNERESLYFNLQRVRLIKPFDSI